MRAVPEELLEAARLDGAGHRVLLFGILFPLVRPTLVAAGVLAFAGGYHGLGYGALTTTHREYFRAPFCPQLAGFAAFAPYPEQPAEVAPALEEVQRRLQAGNIGAVLVEPVQGRGGIRVPPPEFLPALRAACTCHGAWLVLDEIYTGLGRTGRWFACEHTGVVPDLVCLGKALTGGAALMAPVIKEVEEWLAKNTKKANQEAFLDGKQKAMTAEVRGLLIEKAQQAGQSPANPPPRGSVVNILV